MKSENERWREERRDRPTKRNERESGKRGSERKERQRMHEWCFRPRFCTVKAVYTGPVTTWANEMNFVMNLVPGAGSIVRPVDQQSSILPLYHGCPPVRQGGGTGVQYVSGFHDEYEYIVFHATTRPHPILTYCGS